MSNKPLSWPYKAKGARDKAAEAAVASLLALKPLITGKKITDPEILKCLAVINHNQGFIINTLQSVGAQVTVDQDFWTMPRRRNEKENDHSANGNNFTQYAECLP